jgi:hypothetical protein
MAAHIDQGLKTMKNKQGRGNGQAPPQCPYCLSFMRGWFSRYPAQTCERCEQSIVLIPSVRHRDKLTILSATDVAKVVMFPLIVGGVVSFAPDRISADMFAAIVAGARLCWGVMGVWDGTARHSTRIDGLN